MVLSNPYLPYLHSITLSWIFPLVFVVVIIFSGQWLYILIAFVLAFLASFAYRKYINATIPVPANTAVLITGCSSGIGRDAAIALSKAGFTVFATVRKDADAIKLAKAHSGIVPIIMDVTVPHTITAAVDTVKQRLSVSGGALLGLVNNAGYSEPILPLEAVTTETLRRQYETNVIGTIAVTQAFLPLLRASKVVHHTPRVILLSSAVGRMTMGGIAPYCSSKYAIEAIGDALRMEVHKFGIDVIVIQPGRIDSEFMATAHLNDNENVANALKKLDGAVAESYRSSQRKNLKLMMSTPASTTDITSDAIQCALLDTRPLQRYCAGWEPMLITPIVNLVPFELYDRMLGMPYL